jgi:pyruvate ferredoxin oxidoreductase alpha subunit
MSRTPAPAPAKPAPRSWAAPSSLRRLLTGGEAVAHAMRQIDPDVVPVYPITPQTPIIQTFSKLVADGRAHTEIVNVESEHSAMSAAIGSALAGARTITATSSQGLALMAEVVYIAASMRAPLVMAVGNRALSGPINIHCDHSDSMLIRDSGVVQLFVENAQEAYDAMLLAPRLAERTDVLLPVLVCQDGFTITHSAEPVELLDDEAARAYVGEYAVPYPLLDTAHPTTQGPFAMPDYYYELRHQQDVAMEHALPALAELGLELEQLTGRRLGAVEPYRLGSADTVVVCLGSTAGTVKEVVDDLDGVGLLRICSFRPFPEDDVRSLLGEAREVIVLDRAAAPGARGPLYSDVAAALYGSSAELRGHVYGLGGRELHADGIRDVIEGAPDRYVGLRSEPCHV